MSLEEKLDKIRSPKLKNQQQVAVVLSAVEDTLREQKAAFAPTAYFIALLSLLQQSVSPSKILNKELAASTMYLLDTFAAHTPPPLLRSKFTQILTHLVPALTHPEAEAPLLRSAIGVLESLLLAQDGSSWAIKQTEIGPRRAVAGLLNLGLDDRPKVRKRAQEALTRVLKNPPPSPSLDHPASDMCAAATLASVQELVRLGETQRRKGGEYDPRLIHSLQLVKAVAAAGRWPSKRIEPLCEQLLGIARGGNEFLAISALGVFEELFGGLDNEIAGGKLEVVLQSIFELKPSEDDTQLLPPWLAIIAHGYEVYAHVAENEAFVKLPTLFDTISGFLKSSAHSIRMSASQCMISLIDSCIPESSLLDITRSTEGNFQKIAATTADMLSVRYQGAWMEVFEVLNALFVKLRWRSDPHLSGALRVVGDLRGNEGFQGKKQADKVIGSAIHAMGPNVVLNVLPLNLLSPTPKQPGRAWLLPLIRDSVYNTELGHFREHMVPLSETLYQRVVDFGTENEKTVEIKIFETLVSQIWALLPGYCDLPTDLTSAFDQKFAELLANVLYQKVELRSDVCKSLQNLVDSNKAILEVELDEYGEEDLVVQRRISKEQATANLDHLARFSANMLAVLFNVYSTTLPQYRGFILKCLNSFLSITPREELMSTFEKVTSMLENSLAELTAQTQSEKQKAKKTADHMPPMAHTLMDLVITITPYLPAESYQSLFEIFNATVNKDSDPQLQKKAYKIVPRLAETEAGQHALNSRIETLQELLLRSGKKATPPARRDRLVAIVSTVDFLPSDDLYFIPSVLSEVVISAKEVNEKARTAAFELLVKMGEKMKEGGTVVNKRVPHMPDDSPDANATLEEYFTMISAGLAGNTPHMVSASITALTRILWEFKDDVDSNLISELVSTLDLFLTSKNREIVRSALGFVKVCVISLPKDMIISRLSTLIPNIMVWSHEHKAHFKAKVKHIIERMIRRFGYDVVDRYVPEEDKKLIVNIRKTRERRKRKKDESKNPDDEEGHEDRPRRKVNYENEFDEAIYGSESEESGDEEGDVDMERTKKRDVKKPKNYIVEGEEEPLDLLDHRSLAHISSARPLKPKAPNKKATEAKVNKEGKLLLGGSDDEPAAVAKDDDGDLDMGSGLDGVDAYVEAVSGKNAYTRGQRGKVKFSNKRAREEDVKMEDTPAQEAGYESAGKRAKKEKGGAGKGGFKKQVQNRKGLGHVKEGKVGKRRSI